MWSVKSDKNGRLQNVKHQVMRRERCIQERGHEEEGKDGGQRRSGGTGGLGGSWQVILEEEVVSQDPAN